MITITTRRDEEGNNEEKFSNQTVPFAENEDTMKDPYVTAVNRTVFCLKYHALFRELFELKTIQLCQLESCIAIRGNPLMIQRRQIKTLVAVSKRYSSPSSRRAGSAADEA